MMANEVGNMTQLTTSKVAAFPRCTIGVLAIGGCLLAPPLYASEGDLDPAFGDVGRVGPIASVLGGAWSLGEMTDRSLLLAGGHATFVCRPDDPDCFGLAPPVGLTGTSFVIRVSDVGVIDESFQAATLADVQLFAVGQQSDGKLLIVGRSLSEDSLDSRLVVYRLNSDGSLDPSFGADGLVELPQANRGEIDHASAVLVEPDGRVIVAGSTRSSSFESLILIRLLASGQFDESFGGSGIVGFPGFSNSLRGAPADLETRTHILRTPTGGYRVTGKSDAGCQVLGVAPDGTLEVAFGSSGIAPIELNNQSPRSTCSALVVQDGGRLLVAGDDQERGFAVRLLTDGQPDPSFSSTIVADAMSRITAMALDQDGAILVAGKSSIPSRAPAAVIARLLPNGDLDSAFGDAGVTTIDMPSEIGSNSWLRDMHICADGCVLAAGFDEWSDRPIIVRLSGATNAAGPGVIGVTQQGVDFLDEETREVVLEVRRTGGKSGAVSVGYRVFGDDDVRAATGGEDFVEDAGRLEWGDGDVTVKLIRVRILDDDAPEDFEQVSMQLADVQGGAGLGTEGAILANDGAGLGHREISFLNSKQTVGEADGSVTLNISRSGPVDVAVSVQFATSPSSAGAGSDFTSASGTLTWEAFDSGVKTIAVKIMNDSERENNETFTVTLSNPIERYDFGTVFHYIRVRCRR
jgi:uncharacterized delta-60 repeat protein